MTRREMDYAICKNAVSNLSVLCSADPNKIIDLLTGYLWDEEEASDIKQSHGVFYVSKFQETTED